MTRRSFALLADELSDNTIVLRGKRRAHFLKVFPDAKTKNMELLAADGRVFAARLVNSGRDELILQVVSSDVVASPSFVLTLAAAILKPRKMDFLVEKAAELGVSRVLPLITARTMAVGKDGPGDSRLARWRGKAAGATAMNERPWLTRVMEACPITSLVFPAAERVLVLSAQGQLGLRRALRGGPQDLTLVVGPEGDFAPDELRMLKENGAELVRLGDEILRAETASLAALAVINAEWRW